VRRPYQQCGAGFGSFNLESWGHCGGLFGVVWLAVNQAAALITFTLLIAPLCLDLQVANFDMVAEPQQQQQQQQQQQREQQEQQQPAYTDPSTAQQHFWSELLKDHKPADQPEEPIAAAGAAGNDAAAAAASGSRRRRAAAAVRVSYLEELQGWDDISSSGEESAGEEQAEGEGSARKAKKRKQDDDDEAWELPAEQVGRQWGQSGTHGRHGQTVCVYAAAQCRQDVREQPLMQRASFDGS